MTRNTKLAVGAAVILAATLVVWKTAGSRSAKSAEDPPAQAKRPTPRTTAALQPVAVMPEQQMLYADDPVGTERLEGQVIDDNETPIGDAVVVIDANPRREVRTEADGSFVFDRLVARRYKLEARSGSDIAGPVSTLVTADTEPVVLRLRRAADLEVTLVDAATKRPIEGALVELRSLRVISSLTDSTGVAVIHGVGAGTLTLKVSASGYASKFELVTSAGAAGDVIRRQYELRPGVTVSGTVVDSVGQPIEGASVLVEDISFLGALSDPRLDAMITDAKGRWRFDALPRATVRFRASHQRFAPTVSAPVPLADGVERTGVEIALDAGARLTGRVVDAQGAPAASAVVHVGGASVESALIRHAYSDADGRFELLGLPRTNLHLVAMSDGASSALVSVDMTARRERDVSVTLDGDHRIQGVVVDSSGELVPEARVVAKPEISTELTAISESRLRGTASAVADSGGNFAITGLRPGKYRLRAIRPGTPSAVLEMKQGLVVDSNATDARVVVDDLTSATGVVAFADGEPPAVFAVRLGNSTAQSFIDTDGKFTISDVPSGKRYLTVVGPQLVTAFVEEIQLAPGDANDLGTITVSRGRTLKGRVVDSDGRPIAGATIDAGNELQGNGRHIAAFWEETDGTKRIVSGADGSFLIRGVGPTSIVMVADHETAGRSQPVALPASTDDVTVELRLQATGSLRGRISVNGVPAEGGVGVRAKLGADIQLFVTAGPDGTYHFDRLAPGEYVAYAWFKRGTEISGGAGRTIPMTIRSGQTETIDIDFPVGDITATMQLSSEGDVVQYGYGVLVGLGGFGTRSMTITEARAMMADFDPETTLVEGLLVENRSISFSGLMPGDYTACAVPITADPRDPEAFNEFQKTMTNQIMYCVPATLTAEPKQQTIQVPVKLPAPPEPNGSR